MSVGKSLRYYGKNTTVHGLKYVADENRPALIRLAWIAIFILSFYGMVLVFKASYRSYVENAISFVTETAYLNWNTTFPAVTLCEITSSQIAWEGEQETEDVETVEQFVSDLIFFTGNCYSCSDACDICAKLNFSELVLKYRKKCPELLARCRWNGIDFDCCEKFLPLETEYGICYSFNSQHTLKTTNSKLYYYSNRRTGPSVLSVETLEDVRLYFHAREDVPFINSNPDHRKDVMLGENHNISINVIEIENDENVKTLPVDSRACRFPEEKPADLIVHEYYSYSTCVVQCHADNHINLCNCTHHLMPGLNSRGKYCDIEGLQCLTDNFETVNRLHAKGFDKPGLVCDCLPSCVEPEYKVVADTKGIREAHSEIIIKMQSLPTSRFKRVVVRTTMDLVVSIGGAAGLFIGASLLSIVETIYLLLLREDEDSN